MSRLRDREAMNTRDAERALIGDMIRANDALITAITHEIVLLWALLRDTSLNVDEQVVHTRGWAEHFDAEHPDGSECTHGRKRV